MRNKNYEIARDLSHSTKNLSFEMLKKSGYHQKDFLFLVDKHTENRYKLIDFLLQGKLYKIFNKFCLKVGLANPNYAYLLGSTEVKYFMAELFFLEKITKETIEKTNLSGVEWISYKRFPEDNSLYLKVSPNSTVEDIKKFLSIKENNIENTLNKYHNLPYIKLDIRKKEGGLGEVKIMINNLNKFPSQNLHNIAKALNEKIYNEKFLIYNTKKLKLNPRRKYDLISFILFHCFQENRYSDGFIRSVILKKTKK